MKFSLLRATLFMLLSVIPTVARAQYDKDVFFMRGRQALADGKYAASIEQFNILTRLDTTDYWTFFYRGIAKYNLGDLRGARSDFDKAVRLNPVFTSGFHYRAIASSRSGDYEQALSDLKTALELRPGSEGIYFSRGVTYFLARQFDNAVKDFDKYIRKQPRDPSAYLNRGASHLFLEDTLKALSDYNKAIRLDRFEPEGYIRRGRLFASQGKTQDALADMNHAIELDSTNTFAYFNRALMHYDSKNLNAAMADLDRVLRDEPGNALTLYNRSLINAQVGNFEAALDDIDRVININPRNVLAYFNRASFFVQMGRWQNALEDYDKAISLYPDFAKAYMNRSYVKNMLGMFKESRKDYELGQQKVKEYRAGTSSGEMSFADTTKKYSSLLALDAEFAKNDFDDELLQHRDIDVKLKPLYRFVLAKEGENQKYALAQRYENLLIDKYINELPISVKVSSGPSESADRARAMLSDSEVSRRLSEGSRAFLKALCDNSEKMFNSALANLDLAVEAQPVDKYDDLDKAFFLMNRGALRAEMIEFISSMESNVQTLTMDDRGAIRARVKDQVARTYDYDQAISDMQDALSKVPDIPYLHFNLGNLYCLSSKMVDAIDSYGKAIELYPAMGDAYFNRGLVLIYLKDKEKGCIDLSRAGELGVAEAYSMIERNCREDNE